MVKKLELPLNKEGPNPHAPVLQSLQRKLLH